MKPIICTLTILLFFQLLVFGSGETVCVYTGSGSNGQICVPNNIKMDPCATYAFVVNTPNTPAGYFPYQLEWYVNNILVYTVTAPSNGTLNYQIRSNPTAVYCRVTYKNTSDGTLSSPSTSSTFNCVIKELPFAQTITGLSQVSCSATSVSYSVADQACDPNYGALCYSNPNAQYEVTWTAPTGWVQTAISNGGRNVTFTPNTLNGGNIVATIHLNRTTCNFTEVRTIAVSIYTPPPAFSASNPNIVCPSTTLQRFNLESATGCNVNNYTFNIAGNVGITFLTNNMQSLTTTNGYADVVFSSSMPSSIFAIKVIANYSSSVSSVEISKSLIYGAPSSYNFPATFTTNGITNPIEYCNRLITDNGSSYFTGFVDVYDPIVTYYSWSLAPLSPSGVVTYLEDNPTPDHVKVFVKGIGNEAEYILTRSNGCAGVQSHYVFTGNSECQQLSRVAPSKPTINVVPNPATSVVLVQLAEPAILSVKDYSKLSCCIQQIKVTDKTGKIRKLIKGNNHSKMSINLSDLPNDIYTVLVYDGVQWLTTRIMKQ